MGQNSVSAKLDLGVVGVLKRGVFEIDAGNNSSKNSNKRRLVNDYENRVPREREISTPLSNFPSQIKQKDKHGHSAGNYEKETMSSQSSYKGGAVDRDD